MEIRNRMSDVVKLRCNACQDLLKLVIVPGWQNNLYETARDAVTGNIGHYNAYITVYNKMRDFGVNTYSIDDMDVSLICTIVSFWNRQSPQNFAPLQNASINALKELRDDRNVTQHSSENEEPEELYLRALLALINLRKFIRAIDNSETSIPDETRLAYRQEYIAKIESLKDTLDEERIELIQSAKQMDRDIQRILNSDDPLRTWVEIYKIYDDRAYGIRDKDHHNEEDLQKLQDFCVRASDAGIKYAHAYAADYYLYHQNDHAETLRRLRMLMESYEALPPSECSSIVGTLRMMLMRGHKLDDDMIQLINDLKKQGYDIKQTDTDIEVSRESLKRKSMAT